MAEVEPRVRITLFLPVNSPSERGAAANVVAFLNQEFGGSTHSAFQPPMLRGYWVEENGDILIDEITVVIVDAEDEAGAEDVLSKRLGDIRALAFDEYAAAGSVQDEIWLATYDVARVVSA